MLINLAFVRHPGVADGMFGSLAPLISTRPPSSPSSARTASGNINIVGDHSTSDSAKTFMSWVSPQRLHPEVGAHARRIR